MSDVEPRAGLDGPVLVVLTDDEPPDPLLSFAFEQADDQQAELAALRYWRPEATHDDLSTMADVERQLFDKVASYQASYPDLHATAEVIDSLLLLASRSRSAGVLVVSQTWYSRQHKRPGTEGDLVSRGSIAVISRPKDR
jgi:hypothetical protein